MELTRNQIQEILPHRHPFLLVDEILEVEPGISARGIKHVTGEEPWCPGHFPQKAIMPGVLVLEALAQTGAVALLIQPENAGKLVLFGGVKNARFRGQVTPGDTLELSCHIIKQLGMVGTGYATATVGGKTVCTAQLTFALAGEPEL